jgi:hypothetical protein
VPVESAGGGPERWYRFTHKSAVLIQLLESFARFCVNRSRELNIYCYCQLCPDKAAHLTLLIQEDRAKLSLTNRFRLTFFSAALIAKAR